MDERDDLELLLARIQQFRSTQIDYAVRKNTVNEKKKIAAERALDDVVKTMLKKGYDPTRFMIGAKPNNLF
jgi:hypothetical protein